MRQGIRYSTGEPVRPEDFRRAIERVFATVGSDGVPSGGVPYFSGILGANVCEPGNPCDLSRGIVADDDAGTVTFHLTEPTPEFLDALALPFAFAVPEDTPDREVREPVPATGPYMIVAHSDSRIRLERNPHFEEWSAAARPDGFPDRIVWRYDPGLGLTKSRERAVDDVIRGEADLMFESPVAARIERLLVRYRNRSTPPRRGQPSIWA